MSNDTFIRRYFSGQRPSNLICHQNLMMDSHTLYSYGVHFPLAVQTFKDEYVLNGDRYSVTTSRHQSDIRWVHANLCGHIPVVTIPFTVLHRAKIEPREIEILDRTKDEYRTVTYFDGEEEKERTEHLLGASLIKVEDRYFLSGTDESAHWGYGYFLAELPEKVASIKEALETLKPQDIKDAEKMGLDIKRQGEWFFIYAGTIDELKDAVYPLLKTMPLTDIIEKWKYLPPLPYQFEGHHKVRDMVDTEGMYYCRGTVRHDNGQHRMLNLGKNWFSAVPNRALQAWSAEGKID